VNTLCSKPFKILVLKKITAENNPNLEKSILKNVVVQIQKLWVMEKV
jgi:hypothetical protein